SMFELSGVLDGPTRPYLPGVQQRLVYLGVTDPFFVPFHLSLAIGAVAASPVIIYQIWAFLSPALLPREKRAIVPALYLAVVLFVIGASLALLFAVPFTIRLLFSLYTESLTPQYTANT